MKKRYTLTININNDDPNIKRIGKSHIQFLEAGYWLSFSNGYGFTDKDLSTLGLNTILDIDSSEIQDKTFFRNTDLNLPRQKMDLLKDKYNVKVSRNGDKADYHIISNKFLSKIITYSWYSDSTFSAVYEMLKNFKQKDLVSESGLDKFRQILNDTPKDSMVYVNVTHNYHTTYAKPVENIIHEVQKIVKQIKVAEQDKEQGRNMIIESDRAPEYLQLISQKDKLVLDTAMINVIDEGLAVIKNDEYDRIQEMVLSSDRDTRSLVVEMLANCNVLKSFDVVSGIYYWHYEWLKDTNNWNTVNVKSLRQQMKSYEGGTSLNNIYGYNNYLSTLAADNKLTKFAVDKTREKLLKKFLNTSVGEAADVFTIDLSSIKLTEKYQNQVIDE